MKQTKQKYNKRIRQYRSRIAKHVKQFKVVVKFGEVERNRATSYLTTWVNAKPTLPLYWCAVQAIVNTVAVNRGIVPR